MLTPPDLAADTIIAVVRDAYGLRVRQVIFLPIGADVRAAVYRLDADDGTPYFLKLRRGDFDEVTVAVPAFLRAQGIRRVMAPLATSAGQLWTSGHDFTWILYPFVEGHSGFAAPLSEAQWLALGASLRAVHATALPPALGQRVPREDYAPRWRDVVTGFDHQVETRAYDDPVAGRLAAFWASKRRDIRAMVARAAQLGRALQQRARPFVLCHADLHAGNVLLSADGDLAIVDWDEPIFAPRERDLMFVGGGVGAVWDSAQEEAWFYRGYGPTEIDPVALAYYRYERIVADLAAYGLQIFGVQGSVEDREDGLKQVMGQFLPDRVVEIAHRTYQQLP
jgi:spectinomycin phosphotransferase